MSTWALITAFGWGHLQSLQNQNLVLSDTLHPCHEEESFRPRSVKPVPLDLWCNAMVKTSRYGCKTEQFNGCSIIQQLKGCFLRIPLFSFELCELFLPVTVFLHCSYLLMPEAPAEWLHKSPPWQVAGQVSFAPTPRCLGGRVILFGWSAQVCLYLLPSFCAVHFELKHLAVWNTGKTSPLFNFPAKRGTEVMLGFCWSLFIC